MNSDKIVSIMNLNLFSADKTFWAKQRWGKWYLTSSLNENMGSNPTEVV